MGTVKGCATVERCATEGVRYRGPTTVLLKYLFVLDAIQLVAVVLCFTNYAVLSKPIELCFVLLPFFVKKVWCYGRKISVWAAQKYSSVPPHGRIYRIMIVLYHTPLLTFHSPLAFSLFYENNYRGQHWCCFCAPVFYLNKTRIVDQDSFDLLQMSQQSL